jgi:hypothetical protein
LIRKTRSKYSATVARSWCTAITVLPSAFSALQHIDDGALRRGVDTGERLVQEVEIGILRKRPGEEDALLLAAGQLADLARGEIGHADPIEAGPCTPPPRRTAARTGPTDR